MQTSIYNVATKQIHEDPGTAKENDRTQNQAAVKNCEDHAVLREVLPLAAGRRKGSEQCERKNRQQRQQIKQDRSSAEKVFLNLETEDCANLAQPERPGQWCLSAILFAWSSCLHVELLIQALSMLTRRSTESHEEPRTQSAFC